MSVPFAVESKVRCRNQIWEVMRVTSNPDGTFTVRLLPEGNASNQYRPVIRPRRGV